MYQYKAIIYMMFNLCTAVVYDWEVTRRSPVRLKRGWVVHGKRVQLLGTNERGKHTK